MEYHLFGDTYGICLHPGEEIIESVLSLCEKEKITTGTVSGLGAVDRAIVGIYDTEKRKFLPKELNGQMEICSLAGNVTEKDGAPYLHLHGSFADKDGNVFGGHIQSAQISVTAEIFVRVLSGNILRKTDKQTGIMIMDF